LQRIALGIPTLPSSLNHGHLVERLNGHNSSLDRLLQRSQCEYDQRQLHDQRQQELEQQMRVKQQQDLLQLLIQQQHKIIKKESTDHQERTNDSNDTSWQCDEDISSGRVSDDGTVMNRYEKEIDENELREFLA